MPNVLLKAEVTNSMRLLKLDERVQQMLIDEMLTTGHARALLAIEDKEMQHGAEFYYVGFALDVL